MLAGSLKAVVSQRLVPRADGKGMVAAFEVMVANASVRDIIQNGDSFDPLYEVLRKSGDTYGMVTFDQYLLSLYEAGAISRETVLSQATRKEDLELRLRGVSA